MKKSLLLALFVAMPLMAQEAAPQMPEGAPQMPAAPQMPEAAPQMVMPHGPRPELTEEQKAEMKAKFMEKFDADKDGQLSDAEKEAAKAEFQKRAPKCGKKGHRRPCCAPKCEKN